MCFVQMFIYLLVCHCFIVWMKNRRNKMQDLLVGKWWVNDDLISILGRIIPVHNNLEM